MKAYKEAKAEVLEAFHAVYFREALTRADWYMSRGARLAGFSLTYFRAMVKEYGAERG